ncbi:hypothetical protein [Pseudonocardia hydrocarbonoxydans]|uniref:Uncharacterized protein n=1 Tax=Pseudonocardia hydrocarbonoxydans TaxID=76726 RepID=A0A4Y3WQP9_9PSEU|nr:hypothetical protein [Pseudonocardia hydrocarbonoxydans]GEC20818.1 hypothetical protein PHY01_31010 [Pseudonocardia hydrocarbonoxydans]
MPKRTWITPEGEHISSAMPSTGYLPDAGTIELTDWDGYFVQLSVELVNGRYRCNELRVREGEAGKEITGEAIRNLSLSRMIREGVLHVRRFVRPPEAPTDVDEDLRKLQWVAEVYRFAYAVGDPPKQAVAEGLQVSPATAGRWIARSRKAGLLGPAEGPGRAGG